MLYGTYTSIKVVLAKVYRDLQLDQEDRIGDMIEWSAEALDYIGAFSQLTQEFSELEVALYTAYLPANFEKMEMVSHNGRPLHRTTGVGGPRHNAAFPRDMDATTYIVNEASLYTPVFQGNIGNRPGSSQDATYSIEGRLLRTSFPVGRIEIAYQARRVDEDGWPMIPDTQEYREAIFRYIVYKLYYGDFIRGKLHPSVYEKLEQDWWRKCRQCRADANMPDLDTLQNLATSYLSLKPNLTQYNTFFRNLGNHRDNGSQTYR